MRIGILSDTHGMADRLADALRLLTDRRADALVHCGDIGTGEMLRQLADTGLPTFAVMGNVDHYPAPLLAAAREAGATLEVETVEAPLGDGRYLVATHGHDADLLEDLIRGEQFPYVCHGHTHVWRDERIGSVRVINPGALCRPKGPRHPTVALLDTERDTVEQIAVTPR